MFSFIFSVNMIIVYEQAGAVPSSNPAKAEAGTVAGLSLEIG